jgi:inositol oxygenase
MYIVEWIVMRDSESKAGLAAPEVSKNLRDYPGTQRETVEDFYRLNHQFQTYDFARAKRQEYGHLDHARMGVWPACEKLNEVVDDSDPDTELTQLEHLLQTAEATRRDGRPEWFILTGLIHDLGKLLCMFDEPQWAVVGDTFPLGCPFSDKIVYSEFFDLNPDLERGEFQRPFGLYSEGCGLDNVVMSWGHDEYLYQVCKSFLPIQALYIIRYHSFYAAHQEGAYAYLFNDQDKAMFEFVREFQPYDLYSKLDDSPDIRALEPYYCDLIKKYFPAKIAF